MKFIVIIICKLLVAAGRIFRKGTSLPGAVALKLRPEILSELRLPECVVAVSGSNGKTSTVEMIAYVLSMSGSRVIYNKEGSNQIEGVATLLLKNSDMFGRVKADAAILESDERYARHTFKYIKPTHFVVTNLYRDQLTRNAHPFWIYNIVKDAVDLVPDADLILNCDDPIITMYGQGRDNLHWFGMDKNAYSSPHTDCVYNDCFYCPLCKSRLTYSYFHYDHLGDYKCEHCGYGRPVPDYVVDRLELENSVMAVNGYDIDLAFASRYNVYNICAAFSVCAVLGCDELMISDILSDYVMKNGRIVRFRAGDNEGLLITSKHENSTSYNRSLEYVASVREPCILAVIVDQISRKYYTSETSWLWDVSFELLAGSNVRKVLLCGRYAYDLAVRFSVGDFGGIEICTVPDLDEMARQLAEVKDLKIYAVTCFSDKDKLYDRVEVESATAK